jgi:hypothetical protein
VYVVVRSGHHDAMRSEKMQRFTAMSVSALLAANALVLVVGLGDDVVASSPPDAPETVTFIVDESGNRVAVDPQTPEGSRAIADAQERGQEVVSVPAAPTGTARATTTTSSTTTTTRPRAATQPASSGSGLPDVEQVLDDTLGTVVDTVDQVGETVDGTVDQVTDIVDDTTGLDTGSTVDPAVDDLTDTLTTTVSTVVEAVTDITLPPVTVPPVTVPPLPGL